VLINGGAAGIPVHRHFDTLTELPRIRLDRDELGEQMRKLDELCFEDVPPKRWRSSGSQLKRVSKNTVANRSALG
jgi:hypothetical protein